MRDKKHWYDGAIYDKFIAPNQDKLFKQIKNIISQDSTVLDFGCGTGRLSFQLADKCEKVVGLDLSIKNISVAESNLKLNPHNNLSFVHGDISKLNDQIEKYDYAVLTYVIHEVPEKERIKILNSLKSVAKKIIIGDYLVPAPKSLMTKLNYIVEFLAGNEHFTNYKNYVKNGGIEYLIEKSNLKNSVSITEIPKTAQLVIAE